MLITVYTIALYCVLVTELTCVDRDVGKRDGLMLVIDVLVVKLEMPAAGLSDKVSCLMASVPTNSTVLLCLSLLPVVVPSTPLLPFAVVDIGRVVEVVAVKGSVPMIAVVAGAPVVADIVIAALL